MNLDADYSGNSIGKYRLVSKLGRGSFGAVYKAIDVVLNTEKAVKILEVSDPRRAHELFIEAAIPHKCQHTNVVKINGGEILKHAGEFHFVVDMELVNGGSVETLLKNNQLTVLDSLQYLKQILFGLQHSHANGVIHRDLKPANILIDNGIPKISDFGLATALNNLIIPWKWYRTHAAPETYASGLSTATVATDIFALGMTMYRMTNGIHDWDSFLSLVPNADNHMKTGKLIDKLPFKPFIPNPIVRLIKKACKADPLQRFVDAATFRNALERLRPKYNWRQNNSWNWTGKCNGMPEKMIYLEPRRKTIDVLVKNGTRKCSADCQSFNDKNDAEAYLMAYIASTTLG